MNEQQARQRLIHTLDEQAALAEQFMDDARVQLSEHNDQDGYKDKLEQRTALILELPGRLEVVMSCISAEEFDLVERWIGELVEDAGHARQVDSIFYMSVLLYDGPDDGKARNDIARLADKLRQR